MQQAEESLNSFADLSTMNFFCTNNKPVALLCCSSSCTANPMVCCDIQCECRAILHEDCYFGSISSLTKRLQSKHANLTSEKLRTDIRTNQNLIKQYDEMIERISLEREEVKESIQFPGLNQNEIKLYKRMREGTLNESNGLEIFSVFQGFKEHPLEYKQDEVMIKKWCELSHEKLTGILKCLTEKQKINRTIGNVIDLPHNLPPPLPLPLPLPPKPPANPYYYDFMPPNQQQQRFTTRSFW